MRDRRKNKERKGERMGVDNVKENTDTWGRERERERAKGERRERNEK